MNDLIKYIEFLESESFEGWSENQKDAYLTACISIKEMAKKLFDSICDCKELEQVGEIPMMRCYKCGKYSIDKTYI